MPESNANIGWGTTFEMADPAVGTFEYIAELTDLTLPSEDTDQTDVTHFGSPNKTREFISNLSDSGEVSFELNYVPGSDTDKKLIAAKGKKRNLRITFPNGCQMLMNGNRQGYERNAPLDDKMTGTVTFKVTGEPAMTDPTAPRALINPTISGTAKVGVALEVDSGMFAGASELAYQWKVGGVDVSGANGMTYVPVVGDVGETVTCEVTASNDDFDTTVETAATSAVAAAS